MQKIDWKIVHFQIFYVVIAVREGLLQEAKEPGEPPCAGAWAAASVACGERRVFPRLGCKIRIGVEFKFQSYLNYRTYTVP